MTIGFIGLGEAGGAIAAGLRDDGFDGRIVAYDVKLGSALEETVLRRASAAHVDCVGSDAEVASLADLVIAAVPSHDTVEACRQALPGLRAGQIYADVSASPPSAKGAIWEMVGPLGVLFCDAAMLGILPVDRNRVPITASGNGADAFIQAMSPYGMRIQKLSDRQGDASALKLIRSIFMKGYCALLCEMLSGADAYDIADKVIASLDDTFRKLPFAESVDYHVVSTAIHAKRRGDELSGSLELLRDRGLSGDMTADAQAWHRRLETLDFAHRDIDYDRCTWQDVIRMVHDI